MTSQLPALQVLIPLTAAPLCILLRSKFAAWLLFLLASLGALGCATAMTVEVAHGKTISYSMGGWDAPVGIAYFIGAFNAPLLCLVSSIATIVAVYARKSIVAEIEGSRAPFVYACLCLNLAGLLGILTTGDVFNAFVFIEIVSLSSYALIAMGKRRRALLAAFQYLIIGTVGAVFVLIGIGLAYAVTGTLNMADMAARLPDVYGNRALTAAVAFVFIGLAVKMAMFPLHGWLPDAYAEAPSAVATLLSATGTKVAIYIFVRLAFTVFGTGLVFGILPVGPIGLILASSAMVVGSAIACYQTDLKYLLAWSSVAQIGYIIAGFSLATTAGLSASYLHIINHAVIKGALFAVAGVLVLSLGSVKFDALAGLGRTMPWTCAALVIGGLGLIGLPPTAGFVSKWALVAALIDDGQILVVGAVLVSSLLAVIYIGRIVEVVWFREPSGTRVEPPPSSMLTAVWILVLVSLYFGIDASLPGDFAERAADALLGRNGGS